MVDDHPHCARLVSSPDYEAEVAAAFAAAPTASDKEVVRIVRERLRGLCNVRKVWDEIGRMRRARTSL